MGERVPVRIKSENKVVTISRDAAERFVEANPKEYEIISPPKIEVLKLEPIVEKTEKKSAVDAPKEPSEVAVVSAPVTVETQAKNKGGRPKRNP